jgi:hypothetical protein
MKKWLIIILSILSVMSVKIFSQSLKVKNIHYRLIEDKIEIFYDLPVNYDSLEVSLVFCKKSDPRFRHYPEFIYGDIGIGVFSGTKKKIIWSYKKEPDYLFTGGEFYFKISAKKIPKKEDLNPGIN